jgi:hypothetical protein
LNKELIKIDFSANALVERKLVNRLLEVNSTTQKHGLILTETIAKEIIAARGQSLKDNDRIDFSSDTTARLVQAFSQSYYITQETFSETISGIIELFYFLKNETADYVTLSDDEMISEMLIVFNDYCAGVMELMESKGVEKIIRKYKFGDTTIWGREISSEEFLAYDKYGEELYYYDETWRE